MKLFSSHYANLDCYISESWYVCKNCQDPNKKYVFPSNGVCQSCGKETVCKQDITMTRKPIKYALIAYISLYDNKEDVIIALFTTKELALQYIEDSRSNSNRVMFKPESLLSKYVHCYIEEYEEPNYPLNPVLEG